MPHFDNARIRKVTSHLTDLAMSALLNILVSVSRARVLAGRAGRFARREKSQRAEFYRDLWCSAAATIGATVTNSHGELLSISDDQGTARVFRNYTDLDGPVSLRAAGNKPLVHEVLRGAGIPTPEYRTFSKADLSVAEEFLRSHGTCVVKPASGTGAGAGVTTGIKTHRQLFRSVVLAAAYGTELLIEKQIRGKNLRLLYLDGRLLDAVERRPPTVTGDGRRTVAQLVGQANSERREQGVTGAQVFLRHDLDMQQTLAEQGLGWRGVPPAGQPVRLKTVINDNAAVDNVSVADAVCGAIVECGSAAAQALGIRLAGVDIVTTDLTVDLATGSGVVLEINTAPGLYIHKGKPGIPVAVPILEACLGRISAFGNQDHRAQLLACQNQGQR